MIIMADGGPPASGGPPLRDSFRVAVPHPVGLSPVGRTPRLRQAWIALGAMQHVLTTLPYDEKDHDRIGVPDPRIVGPAADFLEPTGAVGAASQSFTT